MIIENSSFLVLYCNNIKETVSFWQNLGISPIDKHPDKCTIDIGGLELHYVLDSTESFASYQFATRKAGRGMGVLHYFEVEDVEHFYKTVSTTTQHKLTAIQKNHWDMREFMFSDPDGYLFVAYGE